MSDRGSVADQVWRAKRRLVHLADGYKSPIPLGVRPSRGAYGSPEDWDVFTSVCDARIALVLALGRRPDPCTGHVLPELEQLPLFEVASPMPTERASAAARAISHGGAAERIRADALDPHGAAEPHGTRP